MLFFFFFLLCKFIYSKTNSKLRSSSQLFHFHILSGLKIVHHVKNSNSTWRWEGTGVGGPSCITFPTTWLPGRGRHSQHWVHVFFFCNLCSYFGINWIEVPLFWDSTFFFFFLKSLSWVSLQIGASTMTLSHMRHHYVYCCGIWKCVFVCFAIGKCTLITFYYRRCF